MSNKPIKKIALLGKKSIGKTSLLNKLLTENFFDKVPPTAGMPNFSKKKLSQVTLYLQDSEDGNDLRGGYLMYDAFVICCDPTDILDCENRIKQLTQRHFQRISPEKIFIVGTKKDLQPEKEIELSYTALFTISNKYKLGDYFYLSAKTKDNSIVKMFETITEHLINTENPQPNKIVRHLPIKLVFSSQNDVLQQYGKIYDNLENLFITLKRNLHTTHSSSDALNLQNLIRSTDNLNIIAKLYQEMLQISQNGELKKLNEKCGLITDELRLLDYSLITSPQKALIWVVLIAAALSLGVPLLCLSVMYILPALGILGLILTIALPIGGVILGGWGGNYGITEGILKYNHWRAKSTLDTVKDNNYENTRSNLRFFVATVYKSIPKEVHSTVVVSPAAKQ